MKSKFDGPENLDREDFVEFMKRAARQTNNLNAERSYAIIAGVSLEEALGKLLINFLVDQKQSRDLLDGALGSFVARINYAYCLGLISPDEFADLHLMRKIRNHFAHGQEGCSFDDEEVKNLCDNLKTIRKNPLQSVESWEVYWGSATILLYILQERTWAAQKRKCNAPEEFDPDKWRDF